MIQKHVRLVAILVALVGSAPVARAEWRGGIGVIGDSYSDEYQFYPPDRATARNWVEILAATRRLNFGEFSSASRSEPRNQGYAYNWARSDATTESMIVSGQHTGLAAQVAAGEVSLVVMFIGGNDFINAMKTADPVAALQQAGPSAEENLKRAVETILAANPDVKLVLVTVPDIRHLPEFRDPLRAGQLPSAYADAATATIRRYNSRIRALAAGQARIALLDLDLVARIRDRLNPEAVMVAGRRIERFVSSNNPNHLFLADLRHLGTVGQGLLAELIVTAIDAKFDAGVPALSHREIVEFLSTQYPGEQKLAGGPNSQETGQGKTIASEPAATTTPPARLSGAGAND
jgi:phospholipase/lecithinase/hemolysin